MEILREIGRRLAALVHSSATSRELDEEMRLHVELRQARLIENGASPDDARLLARQRFGNVVAIREDALAAWGWRWLGELAQDVRYGIRTLRRNPIFAVAAILTLGLATGATTAVFSIVNGLLLRPLPFPEPDRLVAIHGRNWGEDRAGSPDPVTGLVGSLELETLAQNNSFDAIAGYFASTKHLERSAAVERVRVVSVDLSFFDVLRVQPILGRTFNSNDTRSVAVISEFTWRDRFNADPQTIGRTIALDDVTYTITGVMPDSFEFPYNRSRASAMTTASGGRAEVWLPLPPLRTSAVPPLRGGRVDVVARMKRGVRIEQASAELGAIARRIEEEHYRGTATRTALRAVALADEVLGTVRSSLWLLFCAVALVLVAACANVANLLLARMLVRAREVVTRAALGASTPRLVRQFLAESLLLSLVGGLAGIAIAAWGTDALIAFYKGRLPRLHEVGLDRQAFAFLFLACTTSAALFGLAPAMAAARTDPHDLMRTAGGHASTGRHTARLRDGLVILEVTLAFVLAVAAALVVREIDRLKATPSGMAIDNVVVLHMTPRTTVADYQAIEERAASLPGVQAAGFIQYVPLQNAGWLATFEVRGRPPAPGQRLVADLRFVSAGYFQAAGIPMISGRGFSAGDTAEAPRVVLVNQSFARRYFPGEDPIGRELNRGIIVGIVGDVRSEKLGRPAEPELYYHVAQNVAMTDSGLSLVVRTLVPPETLIDSIRSAVLSVNPKLAIFNVKTMQAILDESLWELTLYRWLIGVFATLALVLAAIGLYGMIAYTASSRSHEFAIRKALGSEPWMLVRMIFSRGLLLALSGVACGTAVVALAAWWIGDRTGGITPDLVTCVAVSALLVAITLVACIAPSVRAATINPIAALRQE